MQVVNSSTVKGDFSGTRFTYNGARRTSMVVLRLE
jgi:hypothetical protein